MAIFYEGVFSKPFPRVATGVANPHSFDPDPTQLNNRDPDPAFQGNADTDSDPGLMTKN
jgi:hypothetical protein